MSFPPRNSQGFFRLVSISPATLQCIVVIVLTSVLRPLASVWSSSTLALPLLSRVITRPRAPTASSLSETKGKKDVFREFNCFVVFSEAIQRLNVSVAHFEDTTWSTSAVEDGTESYTTEEPARRSLSRLLPEYFFGAGACIRRALFALRAAVGGLWASGRRKLACAASTLSAFAMSGGLPSSRSLEGRCFLNLEADRPSTSPFLHLSPGTHEIDPKARSLLQQRLEETARCLKSAGRARASSAKKEPFVYVGAPGIAFAFLKLVSLQTGEKLKGALEGVDAFLSPEIVQAGLEEGRAYPQLESSLLSGPAGVCVIRALRAMQQEQLKLVQAGQRPAAPILVHVPEDRPGSATQTGHADVRPATATPLSADFKKAVHHFEQYGGAALEDAAGDEWLYGRAGYLFGCLFLDYLSPGCIDESLINKCASKIIASGQRRAEDSGRKRPQLRFAWHRKEYIGAAHGYFGILHMLLHVRQVRHDKAALAMIRDTLDWLLEMETSKHNWPAVVGEHDAHLCHFCHGAPGAVLAFSTAATVFGDTTYKEAAERAGQCVWRYGLLKKGAGICHGIGGSGYSLLAVYKLTRDPVWLDRAVEHALKAFDERIQADSRVPDNPYSLFEGVAGSMCLLTDLLKDPKNAAFPFFQIGF